MLVTNVKLLEAVGSLAACWAGHDDWSLGWQVAICAQVFVRKDDIRLRWARVLLSTRVHTVDARLRVGLFGLWAPQLQELLDSARVALRRSIGLRRQAVVFKPVAVVLRHFGHLHLTCFEPARRDLPMLLVVELLLTIWRFAEELESLFLALLNFHEIASVERPLVFDQKLIAPILTSSIHWHPLPNVFLLQQVVAHLRYRGLAFESSSVILTRAFFFKTEAAAHGLWRTCRLADFHANKVLVPVRLSPHLLLPVASFNLDPTGFHAAIVMVERFVKLLLYRPTLIILLVAQDYQVMRGVKNPSIIKLQLGHLDGWTDIRRNCHALRRVLLLELGQLIDFIAALVTVWPLISRSEVVVLIVLVSRPMCQFRRNSLRARIRYSRLVQLMLMLIGLTHHPIYIRPKNFDGRGECSGLLWR